MYKPIECTGPRVKDNGNRRLSSWVITYVLLVGKIGDEGGRLCLCGYRGNMGNHCTFYSVFLFFLSTQICSEHKTALKTKGY